MALAEKYVSRTAAGGGTGNSPASPYTFSEMVTEINGGSAAGNRYNILNDNTAYTRSATDTISGSGTSTSPVILRGYTTTIGDGYLGRTNGNGPLITTNMPTLAYNSGQRLNASGAFIIAESLNVTGSINDVVFSIGADSVIVRCRAQNASGNSFAVSGNIGTRSIGLDCDFANTSSGSGPVVYLTNNGGRLIACRATTASSTEAVRLANANVHVVAILNTIYGCGGRAFAMTVTSGISTIALNTIVGCSGDAIDIVTGTTGLQCIIGNIITDNGGYGIDLNSSAVAAFLAYNRYRDNTSGNINLGTDWVSATDYGAVTSGAGVSDYVNAGTNDYNLLSTSPAVSASIPQYASMGALQRSQTGSAGMLYIPNLEGT